MVEIQSGGRHEKGPPHVPAARVGIFKQPFLLDAPESEAPPPLPLIYRLFRPQSQHFANRLIVFQCLQNPSEMLMQCGFFDVIQALKFGLKLFQTFRHERSFSKETVYRSQEFVFLEIIAVCVLNFGFRFIIIHSRRRSAHSVAKKHQLIRPQSKCWTGKTRSR